MDRLCLDSYNAAVNILACYAQIYLLFSNAIFTLSLHATASALRTLQPFNT